MASLQAMNQQQTTYRFIYDEPAVRTFYRLHILPFAKQQHLSFMLVPTVRKKYWPEMIKSRQVFSNRPFSSQITEDHFVRKIRQLEVAEGLYCDDKNQQAILGQAFVIYMTADPLSQKRGFFKFQR